ncbi:MAG: bifunctional adenosylcobinamide kinase/adenosylcobinamide-phosphate guanylyltransferase [Anaerolineae bacterium]|nr:bifunctional adenosylcobinamide kinase/adenosylcobinamide-phosphate guanylyltransferase [Thermoflexus sp.]MDW8064415.1 bifunctional adenosylcobinamide kinase/adenosylcobinamide-phosphate guanylyltransferase [Anaerolineae bacterium]
MRGSIILILGGARSGKSAYAQRLAEAHGQPVLFVATATAGDEEMAERIARHRAQRPPHWRTLEAPRSVGCALREAIGEARVVVVDCVGLLVSNLMMEMEKESASVDQIEARVLHELETIIDVCAQQGATLIWVSNEVGMGMVPLYRTGRFFRDVLGRANQWLAARADQVVLMVAGIPVTIKGNDQLGGKMASRDPSAFLA